MATDQSFESGMGSGRPQGVADVRNDYGVGNAAQDSTLSDVNKEEGLGTGRGYQPNNQGNEYGVGNEQRDNVVGQTYEQGMGATQDNASAGGSYEQGMGSGRAPEQESDGKRRGSGILKKIESVFKKDKK